MDHISLHTPGVSKRRRWRPQPSLKNRRYFSLEPSEDDPVSGTELVMMKKKKNKDQGDVTKKLLSLVSNTSNNFKVASEKQFIVNGNVIEVSKNAGSSLNTKSSPSTQKNKEISSKEDLWKKKIQNTEESKETENVNLTRDFSVQSQHTLKSNDYEDTVKKNSKKLSLNDDNHHSKNDEYISQECSKGMKKLRQDSGDANDYEFKKLSMKKGSFSKEKKTHENEKVEDKTKTKISKTAKLYDTVTVCESNRTLAKHPNSANGKCNLTGVQNLSLKHKSEIKVLDGSGSMRHNEGNRSQILSEADIPDKKSNQNDVSFESKLESQMSGDWNVQNCDGSLKKKITLKSPQRCKTKMKFASNIAEDAGLGISLSEQRQRNNSVEEIGRLSESKMGDNSWVEVPKNNKSEELEKESCNSQPIVVEMSGVHNVPSNPIHHKVSYLKKKNVTPMFKLHQRKASWKPSSIVCSSENWKVQYGNTDNLRGVENENFESENERLSMEYKENEMTSIESDQHFETESNLQNSHNLYHLFNISDSKAILALPPSYSLFFKGVLKVRVLIGKITVLGYEITGTSQEYTVYSPFGVSLPGIQACAEQNASSSAENYWQQVANSLHQLKEEKSWIQERILYEFPEFSSIILLEQISETFVSFIDKYMPILRFPSAMDISRSREDASRTLRVLFVDPRNTEDKLYREHSAWDPLVQFLLKREPDQIRVMACGGKGVGKSTLLRFLSNKTLSKHKKVLYIDFDPGQCEFTVPGCVSAVIVKNPLLGPNFTHVTCPERMIYVGEVDIARCSTHYLQSVKEIFYWCYSQPHLFKMPWFINTMGFVRGLGVELIVTIIKMINPSDLIQISSSVMKRNYEFHLNCENVKNYVSSLQTVIHKQEKELSYAFHLVPSSAESPGNRNSPWGMQANVARETIILSYFSQVVTPPTFSLLDVVPYKLPFSGLKLCVSHEKIKFCDYILAMNANLVGLCDAKNVNSLKPNDPEYPEIIVKPPICQCVGFGIVRGVDLEKKVFYIITPIEPRKLKIVNCLILGSVRLPDSVYTFQEEAQGTIPYVIEGDLLPLGREVRAAKPVPKLRT